MAQIPESPDGVTLAALLMVAGAAIAALIGTNNRMPLEAVYDSIAEARRALDGERPVRSDPRH